MSDQLKYYYYYILFLHPTTLENQWGTVTINKEEGEEPISFLLEKYGTAPIFIKEVTKLTSDKINKVIVTSGKPFTETPK